MRYTNEMPALDSASIASRLPAVVKRRSDTKTYKELKRILQSSAGPSTIIQRVSVSLRKAETVNSILFPSEISAKEAMRHH